uniref:Doublesex- and mab-3-related transcription factor C1/C2 C-terminal domain-containing protein n=1 Tax=Oryctolagus cuniculus TaxID=9986 RepID=A0A5F9D201_RABIT
MKNTAIAPRAPLYVKNMATGAGVNTGKVNIMPQPQAYPCYIPNLVQKGSEQDVVAASECQRKLEAAEALLALKYSRPVPTDSTTLAQPCGPPAPAGDKTHQTPGSALHPRPTTSISLPIGYIGCISLLR